MVRQRDSYKIEKIYNIMLKNEKGDIHRMKKYIRDYPITSLFFVINSVMVLVMYLKGGFTIENLYYLGGFFKEVFEEGEYYRFISSMFLHGSFFHFLMNMAVLLSLGKEVEYLVGKFRYFTFYIISGVLANMTYVIFGPEYTIAIGASGALYGVFGFFFCIALFKKYINKEWKNQIYVLLGINIVITFIIPNISIWGHLGGLIAGFILSFFLSKTVDKKIGVMISEFKIDTDIEKQENE